MTPRERFEEQKEILRRYIEDGERNRIDGVFLISLVEAAITVGAEETDGGSDTYGEGRVWDQIEQRMGGSVQGQAPERIGSHRLDCMYPKMGCICNL